VSPAQTYRWQVSEFAAGYDAAAEIIHPHYLAIQDQILNLLPLSQTSPALVVDLGGGSGRLMERILDRNPLARGIVIDMSEPFLALAERRLARFGQRATCVLSRLQDDWRSKLPGPASAIVSMSAIHHLEPTEKETVYRRCFDALSPSGVLLNGDEVRPPQDDAYLRELTRWADHMRAAIHRGAIDPSFHKAPLGWIDRNVTRFGQPKRSGDDCHETIDAQLAYFLSAGFSTADSPWQRELWAVLRGVSS
jgi:cyclopropane fatty-acyl-phospholipid synthase-like methyltransferase